jgi:hypothetical protein
MGMVKDSMFNEEARRK